MVQCFREYHGHFNFDLFVCTYDSEEEISAMRKELEKYGIQMPAFSKIGGILESEVQWLTGHMKIVASDVLCLSSLIVSGIT